MSDMPEARRWLRRARPLLGTLVEVGIEAGTPRADAAFDAAYAAVDDVQRCLSRFDPQSDISLFNALCGGEHLRVRGPTVTVLRAARALGDASAGLFDITLGSGPVDWFCEGAVLHKSRAATRIDLGGIGKGHAVDAAVEALLAHGCADGWVNAGGDLRAFGEAEVPVSLRDERCGGVRPFATVADGAFATSHYEPTSRALAHAPGHDGPVRLHASVAAPECLWADALTKVVVCSGDVRHPLLTPHGAQAWIHSNR